MTDPSSVDTKLERSILHGLLCEWRTARDDLPERMRRRLMPPLLRLADLTRTWGQWSAEHREIVISRRLTHHHPWDAVREVLHHEMAHQLATLLLDGGIEQPHGPCFHQACRLLKANPRASDNYPPLDERVTQSLPRNSRDRLMVRIRKLLALAASPHPKEAQAAMLKARELTDKYNVAQMEMERPAGYLSVFLGQPALRHTRDSYHLSHLITSHYWVAGLWIPAYVVAKGKMGRVLEISGSRTNVQSAAYVHDYIRHYIQAQWRSYRQNRRLNQHRRVDFAVGVIEGFQGKLDEDRRAKTPGGFPGDALTTCADPNLAAYMARRYPRTRAIHRQPRQTDARVLADGLETGRRLVIAQGIETRRRDSFKALPAPK